VNLFGLQSILQDPTRSDRRAARRGARCRRARGVLGVRRRAFTLGLGVQAAGAAGVALAGFWTLGSGTALGAGFASSFAPRLGVDALSGSSSARSG